MLFRSFLAFVLFIFSAGALAETPRNGDILGRPAIWVDEEDCRAKIIGQFVAARLFDDIVLAEARARAICAKSAGDLTIAYAEARKVDAESEVIEARAGNDSVMTVGVALAAAQGGSTCYKTDGLETCTGAAATEEARAKGLVTWQQGMNPALYGNGLADPRLDASVGIAQQSFAGFNQSQIATDVWRKQALTAVLAESATQQALVRATAEAKAAKKEAATLRTERDTLLDDIEAGVSEP